MNDLVAQIKQDLERRASTVGIPPITTGRNLRRIRVRRVALGLGAVAALVAVPATSLAVVGVVLDRDGTPSTGWAKPSANNCPSDWTSHTNEAGGIGICTPRAWTYRDTNVSGPRYPAIAFAVGTWDFPTGGDCAPTNALTEVPRGGAFFYAFEYPKRFAQGALAFGPRPSHFTLGRLEGPFECLGVETYLIRFREDGRLLQIHVKFGPQGSKRVKRLVLRSLDSITIDGDDTASPSPPASETYPGCPELLEPGRNARRHAAKVARGWARQHKPDADVKGFRVRTRAAAGRPQGTCVSKKIPNRDETWRRTIIGRIRWRFAKGSVGASSASLSSSTIFIGRTQEGWRVYYQFH